MTARCSVSVVLFIFCVYKSNNNLHGHFTSLQFLIFFIIAGETVTAFSFTGRNEF